MSINDSFGAYRAGYTILREVLYVDTGRVRSYLAQLQQGLPERVQQAKEEMRHWSAGTNVMIGQGETGRQSTSIEQEDRSLTDLHFAIFEDVAEQAGFLTDVSELAANLPDWTSGRLHSYLREGHAIRVTAPTRLTDGEHILALIRRLSCIDKMMEPAVPPDSPGYETTATTHLLEVMRGTGQSHDEGAFPKEFELAVSLLFGPGIWVRCMPCGPEHPEACFSGVLLDRSDYIDPERFAIFSRYGAHVQEWTVVGTINRISRRAQKFDGSLEDLTSKMITAEEALDRDQMERILTGMLEFCEAQGITEGPRWPSVIITPLVLQSRFRGQLGREPDQ